MRKAIQWPRLLVMLGCSVVLWVSAASHAGSIEKMQAFVAETRGASARFVQTQLNNKGKKISSTQGKLSFARPGRFRWEYEKPYEQLIVGDGDRLWVYDKDLNQVTAKKLDGALGSSPAALLAGSNDMEEHYQLSAKGMKGGLDWLEALPREESLFQKVRMGFNGKTLEAMDLHDHLGQVTSIRFSKVEKNPRFADALFTFTAPAGADVITE
ncbi:MAG: outer membrane lipoprotein chaperone LolA [Betaproteobacteria bacterium]|nr:outer membrane lipoprotein chaperone LolA [Betaproteobacteria bacterium]